MIVEATVVDRSGGDHLLRTDDGRLLQAAFDGETMYRIGDLVTLNTAADNVEWIS